MRGGGAYGPPASFFCFGVLIDFVLSLSAIFFPFKETIENLQFAVQIEIFPQNTFLCPSTTYSGLCRSDHPCMKILFLVGVLGLGVIYSEKKIEVRRSPPKIM